MLKNLKFYSLFLGIFCLCGSLSAHEIREWRNKQGDRFDGRFVRILLGKVTMENADGEKLYIPLKELSEFDQRYLSFFYVPEVKITFADTSRAKSRSKNALADDIIRMVTGTATVKAKRKIESCTLQMEVYLIGEEVATDDFKLLEKASTRLELTEKNNYTCQLAVKTQSRKYMEYNRQLRGCLYLGYVVVLLDRTGQVVQFKSDLRWVMQDRLDVLRQIEVGLFFDDDLQSRPIPTPEYTKYRVGVQ